jgi:ATP-binding protein involved in chromosome partitioning
MQTGSIVASVFENITRKVVEETVRRNDSLPATEAIKLPQWQDVLPLKNNKE